MLTRILRYLFVSFFLYMVMADHENVKSDISFAGTLASSSFAACIAEICTIPLDIAKIRLQLQKKATAGDGVALLKYRGLLGTVGTIAREEGLAALWKGIILGLHRQCLFGGLRIGLYDPVKTLYVGKDHVGDVPLSKKVLAALTTVLSRCTLHCKKFTRTRMLRPQSLRRLLLRSLLLLWNSLQFVEFQICTPC